MSQNTGVGEAASSGHDRRHDRPAKAGAGVWQSALGYAGLIPFWGLTILLGLGIGTATQALLVYGAVIVSFMAAIHWGLALLRADWHVLNVPGPLFAVIPALLAWGATVWLPASLAALMLAALLLLLWAAEKASHCEHVWGLAYARLRGHLTLGASAALVVAAAVLAL